MWGGHFSALIHSVLLLLIIFYLLLLYLPTRPSLHGAGTIHIASTPSSLVTQRRQNSHSWDVPTRSVPVGGSRWIQSAAAVTVAGVRAASPLPKPTLTCQSLTPSCSPANAGRPFVSTAWPVPDVSCAWHHVTCVLLRPDSPLGRTPSRVAHAAARVRAPFLPRAEPQSPV